MHVNLLLNEGERGKLERFLRVIEGLVVNIRMYAKMMVMGVVFKFSLLTRVKS